MKGGEIPKSRPPPSPALNTEAHKNLFTTMCQFISVCDPKKIIVEF